MNRREALAALVSLPATARISMAQLKPEDVIVIECEEFLTQEQMARMRDDLHEIWPDHKIVIVTEGFKLKVRCPQPQ